MARSLSADLCKRLARLLPLLSSDQTGEVIATAAAISRALKGAERDWHDLTAALTSPPAPTPPPRSRPGPKPAAKPPPRPDEKQQAIDSEYVIDLITNIRASRCYLSSSSQAFLDSLEERAGRYDLVTFSERQWMWFVDLLEKAAVDFDMEGI